MSQKDIEIICKTGKKIVYREISPGEILDLILACGADGAQNDAYIGIAQQWCGVRSINNIPIPFPLNRQAIRDLANELGHDGISALEEHFEETPSIEQEISTIKN